MVRQVKRGLGIVQISGVGRIAVTQVAILPIHYAIESKSVRQLSVHIKRRRIHSQAVARHTGETLDEKRRATRGIGLNEVANPFLHVAFVNSFGAKNENVTAPRLHEIVAELIDEDLVARVHGSARDRCSFQVGASLHAEILRERLGRRVNHEWFLVLPADFREGKEESVFLRNDLPDGVFLGGNDIDVVASEDEVLTDPLEKIREGRRRIDPVADDPIQRRLHGTGRNLERLQKIGPNSDRDHDCDQDHFYVFPPGRVLGRGQMLGIEGV